LICKENNMKKKNLYTLLVMLVCMALPLLSIAQAGPDDPNDVPIDGGLSLLVAAGAAYGIKKYRDARKKDDEPEMK
jgi:hypothetical protein